ncbi:MAG TPA: endolytic transglycosylase MltG [Bacteroidales bacterium]|nr:endolytic transglycosylase MltG [Bacteroidales bacterium]
MKNRQFLLIALLVLVAVALVLGYRLYQRVLAPGVFLRAGSVVYYIEDTVSYPALRQELLDSGWVRDVRVFDLLAERKGLKDVVRPGRYRLTDGMSLNELVNMLRSGRQEPVKLVLRPQRTLDDLIAFLDLQLQPGEEDFRQALRSDSLLGSLNLNSEQILLLPVPNTYEVWWTVTAPDFAQRMAREYQSFWNDERRRNAESIGLEPAEVGILASIVQQETNKREEMPTIAGVYLNRLRKGMLLQADPTVKFALGRPELRRILHRHLVIDSPYNTYRYPGLPPGPIIMPEPQVIDAVLQAEHHSYLFFCARADLSGYHAFARTDGEHARNARAYRRALNQRGIYR